ncbi:MAG: flagellar hook-length control protein FliK [Nitrosospira sp.]
MSPALPDSSANLLSPQRNSAANPSGDVQSHGTSSFGKVLANELSNQSDASGTGQGEEGATPYVAATEVVAATKTAQDLKIPGGDSKDAPDDAYPETSKSPENSGELQNLKDMEGSAAVATKVSKPKEAKMHSAAVDAQSQPADLAEILHGLIAAYSPHSRSDTSTLSSVEKTGKTEKPEKGEKTETPAEHRTVDASADARAQLASPADLAALPSILPGVAGARAGRAESFDAFAPTPNRAASNPTSLTTTATTHRIAAAAQAREKHVAGIMDTREQVSNKLDADTRQPAATQMELSLPGISTGAQPGKPENPLPEFASKDFTSGLFNTAAVPAGSAADRGIAPTVAGMPAYGGATTGPGLEPRLGAAGWDNALGQKVLWMVSQQQQVAELTLNPPDLGPLQVVLTLNNDQASATFISQNADVRQALEAALPRLREMMADSGLSLGNTAVSADTSQQQGGFERSRSAFRHSGGGGVLTASNAQAADIGMSRIQSGGSRLVDTFA